MKPCWKRMSSGKYVDLSDLSPGDLDIYDIETSLKNIFRFTGHYQDVKPLSVAQHTKLCVDMARVFEPTEEDLHLAILVHDFAEAYIGDVATPVKRAMGDRWYDFAIPIEQLVEHTFYGSYIDPEMHSRVKMYDTAALDVERRVMWSSQYGKDKWPASPLNLGTLENKAELFDMALEAEEDYISTSWHTLKG